MSSMTAKESTRTGRRRSALETREHILGVAQRLFYWDGIRATGVDRLAAEAGVAPTALYRLFGSKDGVVAAYVQASADSYREWILEKTAPSVGSPRERILGLFDATLEQVQPDLCRGCPFLMTLAEYPDASSQAHAIAVDTKRWVRERLRTLVAELREADGVNDVDELADQLALLLEGIYGSVQALTVSGPAVSASSAADKLMTAAIRV